MLNFKIHVVLKELLYIFWALRTCLTKELFLQNIKNKTINSVEPSLAQCERMGRG